jgi:uncharacterized membrane protein YtjA (UPF0391 family)
MKYATLFIVISGISAALGMWGIAVIAFLAALVYMVIVGMINAVTLTTREVVRGLKSVKGTVAEATPSNPELDMLADAIQKTGSKVGEFAYSWDGFISTRDLHRRIGPASAEFLEKMKQFLG